MRRYLGLDHFNSLKISSATTSLNSVDSSSIYFFDCPELGFNCAFNFTIKENSSILNLQFILNA